MASKLFVWIKIVFDTIFLFSWNYSIIYCIALHITSHKEPLKIEWVFIFLTLYNNNYFHKFQVIIFDKRYDIIISLFYFIYLLIFCKIVPFTFISKTSRSYKENNNISYHFPSYIYLSITLNVNGNLFLWRIFEKWMVIIIIE